MDDEIPLVIDGGGLTEEETPVFRCIAPPQPGEFSENPRRHNGYLEYLAAYARLTHSLDELHEWCLHHKLVAELETKRGASDEKLKEYTLQARAWSSRIEWIFARRAF